MFSETLGLVIALLPVIALLGRVLVNLIDTLPIAGIAALGALYIWAAVFGRIAGCLILRFKPRKVKYLPVGIELAESTLLIAVLAGASARFVVNLNDAAAALENYMLKPLIWIMPLGSIAAAILGMLYARRVMTLLAESQKADLGNPG